MTAAVKAEEGHMGHRAPRRMCSPEHRILKSNGGTWDTGPQGGCVLLNTGFSSQMIQSWGKIGEELEQVGM